MTKLMSRKDPDYNYNKRHVTIDMPEEYPVVEKTYNALLYPEGPKDEIDLKQLKPGS